MMEKFSEANVQYNESSTRSTKFISVGMTLLCALLICRAVYVVPKEILVSQETSSVINSVDHNEAYDAVVLNFIANWKLNESESTTVVNINEITHQLEASLNMESGLMYIDSVSIGDEYKSNSLDEQISQQNKRQANKCSRPKFDQSSVSMTIRIKSPGNCGALDSCQENLLNEISDKLIRSFPILSMIFVTKDGNTHNVQLSYCNDIVHIPQSSLLPKSCVTKEVQANKTKLSVGAGSTTTSGLNDIIYYGGPVMTNPVAYVIWYGNWNVNNATSIIENFLRGLGSTPWWDITREYNNTASITFGSSITDQYSQGTNLTASLIWNVVQRALTSSLLPTNNNGLYFVLTSADVIHSGFCTSFCGWHSYMNFNSNPIKYSWVGDPTTQCPRSCGNQTVTPNGNFGADSMISVIAHEATEAVTDPLLNAWKDGSGFENADKCAWDFGNTSVAPNGARYNIISNGQKYFVQQNWRLLTQNCSLFSTSTVSRTTTTTTSPILTAYYYSALDSADSFFNRPYGIVGTNYYYEALRVVVSAAGKYTLRSSSSMDTFGYLYTSSFDPFNPTNNMVIYDDDSSGSGQFLMAYYLQPGTTYYLVFTTYTGSVTGSFTATVSGPSQAALAFVIITSPTPVLRCLGSTNDPICPGVAATTGSVITINPSNRVVSSQSANSLDTLFFNLEDPMTRKGYLQSVTIQYATCPSATARLYVYTVIPVAGSYIMCSQYVVPASQISTTQYTQTYTIPSNFINIFSGAYIGIGIQDTSAIVALTNYGSVLFMWGANQSANVPGRYQLYFQPYGLPYGAKLTYTIVT